MKALTTVLLGLGVPLCPVLPQTSDHHIQKKPFSKANTNKQFWIRKIEINRPATTLLLFKIV